MIRVFLGADSVRARTALNAAAAAYNGRTVRLTDVSARIDVATALSGGGMFAEKRTVILDRVSDNEELWRMLIDSLELMAAADDAYLILEEKLDAAVKKRFEKAAAKIDLFDLPKKAKDRPSVFSLVNHMRAGDKKKLWVAYQEELANGNAAEAIHGVLFWGAKQMLLQARGAKEEVRAKAFLITLTELPHESRRKGEELEYALERFVLSI